MVAPLQPSGGVVVVSLLVVLDEGDRSPTGVIRGLAYRELLAANGFAARFETLKPLHIMDWMDRAPLLLRRVILRPALQRWVITRAALASEKRILRMARKVDVVYLVKVFPFSFVHAVRRETTARIVYDFCDALWLRENTPDAFNDVLRSVDAVTTDNAFTAAYARQFNENCAVIPDAPPLDEFDRRRAELGRKADDRIVLGWIGSPRTTYNLYVIWEALEELFARHPRIHLRLVGTGTNLRLIPAFANDRFSHRPYYNQADMIEEIFGMHIGLFPLQNVERCRTRGVLKATNYMSGEAVVVTSPVGQCVDVIADGVNGMIAASTREWIDKLELLIGDAAVRQKLARNGLETVRSRFRLDQSFAKLKEVLNAGNGAGVGRS